MKRDFCHFVEKKSSAGGQLKHSRAGITGIGGDKFSGKPSDWPDTKTEIIGWLEASGYSYIAKTGTILFHFAGSGDHDHLEDGDLERHYASKMWPTQLRSIRSQLVGMLS